MPRCAFRVDRCETEAPPLRPLGTSGRLSACWEAERLSEAMVG
jgi:hypothetical protein